ncbi:MAG: mobile mystery protein B [Bacteroidetes bacterium]|nr:mobile mystery protein B [Bacteroidota bacterium]
MELKITYVEGQNQLNEEELNGLKLTELTTYAEICTAEERGIAKTTAWVEKNYFKAEKIFTEAFLKEIHKRMLSEVWLWAGKFRLHNKNLGVDKIKISSELKQLMSNTRFWIEDESYTMDEIALRFAHRLMQIQPFPDGNARHAKIMANVILEHLLNSEIFTWGESITNPEKNREAFLDALRKADKGKMDDLLKFARS